MRRRDHFDEQGCILYLNTRERDVNTALDGRRRSFFREEPPEARSASMPDRAAVTGRSQGACHISMN
jgi:hypothetical protein